MRHSTRNVLLLGFFGCLLHLTGCGGSPEPTPVASNDSSTANTPAEPASATAGSTEENAPAPDESSGSYEDPSGSGEDSSGGYEDPGGSYGGASGYEDPGGSYGGASGYEDPGGGYGDSAYGGGPMGYGDQGYGGGRRGNGIKDQLLATVMGMVTPAVSKFANDGATQSGPKSFLDRAAEAYKAGNEPLARKLYLAHLVGEFEDADQAFAETQFSNILKRPVWAMQWGVSVHVHFSGDGEEKIHPVRENMPSPMGVAGARRGMPRGNAGGAYGDPSGGYGDPSGGYGDAGGGYGDPSGGYGDDGGYGGGYGPGSEGAMQAGGPGMGRGPRRGSAEGGALASTVDLSEQLGLVADVTSEMFASRLSSGAYGSAFAAYERQAETWAASSDAPANGRRAGPRQPGAAYGEISSATGEYGAGPSGMNGGSGTYEPPGSGGYGMESEDDGYGMAPGSGEYGMEMEGGGYGMAPGSGGYGMESEDGGYGMAPGSGGYGMESEGGGYGMQPGSGGYGMQPGGMGPMNRAAASPTTSVPAPELPRWRPGIVFVGKLNSAEALANAQEHSLDFLIHFDVAVRTSQTGGAKNVTRLRVYPTAANKPLVTSKPIDNYEIYKLAQADRKTEREYVEEIVGSLFEILDEKMVMRPMPTLKRAVAQERVISLIESANEDLLRSLAEIRLYQWQQAIGEEDVATAFHMTAGDDGLTILHGLPEAKAEILERHLDASP